MLVVNQNHSEKVFEELEIIYKELEEYFTAVNAGRIHPYEANYIARRLADFTAKYAEYMLSILAA